MTVADVTKTTAELLLADMEQFEERLAAAPAEIAAMRKEEEAQRQADLAAGHLEYLTRTDLPSDGVVRTLQTIKQALRELWKRYATLVGPTAWQFRPPSYAPVDHCHCDALVMTSPRRLACAVPEGCGQSFEFTDLITTRLFAPSDHVEAARRAARRITRWVRCNNPRAVAIVGLAQADHRTGEEVIDADLFVEIDAEHAGRFTGYRWLRPLGVPSAEPEVAEPEGEDFARQRADRRAKLTDPAKSTRGESFAPTTQRHAQETGTPKKSKG